MKNTLLMLMPTRQCFLCKDALAGDFPLCDPCWQALPRIDHPCPSCAMPMPVDVGPTHCGACQTQPLAVRQMLAPFLYATPFRELIRAYKFHQTTSIGKLLAVLLYRQIALHLDAATIDYIVPVPLAPTRMGSRGFNQSLEMSRYLSKWLGIPIAEHWILRKEGTRSQVGLGKKARQQSLRGIFVATQLKRGVSVLLVDDVVTTGSTVRELVEVLQKAGARVIRVCAVARAV